MENPGKSTTLKSYRLASETDALLELLAKTGGFYYDY